MPAKCMHIILHSKLHKHKNKLNVQKINYLSHNSFHKKPATNPESETQAASQLNFHAPNVQQCNQQKVHKLGKIKVIKNKRIITEPVESIKSK